MRAKIPRLIEALSARFSDHHQFLVRLFLDRIDAHSADIDRLTERIEEVLVPFRLVRELLTSIPGFNLQPGPGPRPKGNRGAPEERHRCAPPNRRAAESRAR